jgi:NMD protein affecting ribosome stability and mRNA decay
MDKIVEKKYKCIKCGKEYELFCISNYNLGLCKECFKKEDEIMNKKSNIIRDESVDEVTHKVTCPKCGRVYEGIWDEKCKTKGCPVWFFWDDLDCKTFARWYEED